MADVSARMLALLSALQSGREWSGAALAARLGTSPRTLRRDVDRLRGLGYPVETRPGPGGHYRLVAGTSMPPLLLEDDEAVAIAVGLRLASAEDPSAEATLRKLVRVLPGRLRRTVAAVAAATETGADPSPTSTALLGQVAAAIQQGRRLRFSYRARDRSTTARLADPFRQVRFGRSWYLLAWDVERAGWRTFRLDRISDAALTEQHVTPREPPDRAGVADLWGATHRAVIEFAAPADRVADLLSTDGDLEPLADGSCRFTTWVDSYSWLAITTATLDVDFRVVEPAEFTDHCRELRNRLDRALR